MTAVRPEVPCGKVCPERTAECKLTCKKWATYEAEYKEYEKEKTVDRENANDAYIFRQGSYMRKRRG